MTNLAPLINSSLSKELHATIYLLGYLAQKESFKVFAVEVLSGSSPGKENRDLDLVVDRSAAEFAKYVVNIMPGRLQCFERFGDSQINFIQGNYFDMVTARQEFYAGPVRCRILNVHL